MTSILPGERHKYIWDRREDTLKPVQRERETTPRPGMPTVETGKGKKSKWFPGVSGSGVVMLRLISDFGLHVWRGLGQAGTKMKYEIEFW